MDPLQYVFLPAVWRVLLTTVRFAICIGFSPRYLQIVNFHFLYSNVLLLYGWFKHNGIPHLWWFEISIKTRDKWDFSTRASHSCQIPFHHSFWLIFRSPLVCNSHYAFTNHIVIGHYPTVFGNCSVMTITLQFANSRVMVITLQFTKTVG